MDLNTDPLDVYRRWINQRETESGEKSALPYDVEREDALKHEPVRAAIETTTKQLFALVTEFLVRLRLS